MHTNSTNTRVWIACEQMDMFLRNPRFVGLKFPDMSSPELIENKYQGKLTGHALSFLKGLLQMEPGVRTPACARGDSRQIRQYYNVH